MSDLRIYIIVRADLDMPIGKAMGQATHAAEGALSHAFAICPLNDPRINNYEGSADRTKIVLRVKSLAQLQAVQQNAAAAGLPHYLVTDHAKTVFPEPTITCLGIGPCTAEEVPFLKRLQLY